MTFAAIILAIVAILLAIPGFLRASDEAEREQRMRRYRERCREKKATS